MFSLSSLAAALQGGPEDADDNEQTNTSEEQPEKPANEGPKPSLWTGITALTTTVKQRTAELAASVRETDWKSELTAFEQGFREDTTEISRRAKDVTGEVAVKAKTAAQNAAKTLPSVVDGLPEHAGTIIQNSAKGAQQKVQQATRSISTLGGRVVVGASDLFDQISHAIQNEMQEGALPGATGRSTTGSSSAAAVTGGVKYSRFEADVAAMQRDSSTYCDEPEDLENFETWMESFDLDAKKSDIDKILADNTFMSELQSRIVPLIVEYDVFWTRYFYRLYKLEQKHEQFVQLTQRVEQQDEEEVGWGSDDDLLDEQLDATGERQSEDSTGGAVVAAAAAVVATSLATEEAANEDVAEEELQKEEEIVEDKEKEAEMPPVEQHEEEEDDGEIEEDGKNETVSTRSPEADAQPPTTAEEETEEANSVPDNNDAASSPRQPSDGDKTLVASTASDGSDASGKEPWCVVTESNRPTDDIATEEPAPQEEEVEEEPEKVEERTTTTTANEQQPKEDEKEEEFKDAEEEEDVDFGEDIGDVPVAEGDDLDEDWGDDVADWE